MACSELLGQDLKAVDPGCDGGFKGQSWKQVSERPQSSKCQRTMKIGSWDIVCMHLALPETMQGLSQDHVHGQGIEPRSHARTED